MDTEVGIVAVEAHMRVVGMLGTIAEGTDEDSDEVENVAEGGDI